MSLEIGDRINKIIRIFGNEESRGTIYPKTVISEPAFSPTQLSRMRNQPMDNYLDSLPPVINRNLGTPPYAGALNLTRFKG